jgi:hypothetical protein
MCRSNRLHVRALRAGRAAEARGDLEETRAKRIPKGSWPLLREAVMAGEYARGNAPTLTVHEECPARTVLDTLIEKATWFRRQRAHQSNGRGRSVVSKVIPTRKLKPWAPENQDLSLRPS